MLSVWTRCGEPPTLVVLHNSGGSHHTLGSTMIWDLEVDGEIYVRSRGGLHGRWYRHLRPDPAGDARVGGQFGHLYPFHAEPVDDDEL